MRKVSISRLRNSPMIKRTTYTLTDMTGHGVIECELCMAELDMKIVFYCHERSKSDNDRRNLVRYLQNTFVSKRRVNVPTWYFKLLRFEWMFLQIDRWLFTAFAICEVTRSLFKIYLTSPWDWAAEFASQSRTRLACSTCPKNVLNMDEIVYI